MLIDLNDIIKLAKLGTKEKVELARDLLLDAQLCIPTDCERGKKDVQYLSEIINNLRSIG